MPLVSRKNYLLLQPQNTNLDQKKTFRRRRGTNNLAVAATSVEHLVRSFKIQLASAGKPTFWPQLLLAKWTKWMEVCFELRCLGTPEKQKKFRFDLTRSSRASPFDAHSTAHPSQNTLVQIQGNAKSKIK
jgi:hypothetical protein